MGTNERRVHKYWDKMIHNMIILESPIEYILIPISSYDKIQYVAFHGFFYNILHDDDNN